AVAAARSLTSPEETLILVTADHSHTFMMAGYARRGNPILGKAERLDEKGDPTDELMLAGDGKPYTSLAYINGPGAPLEGRPRPDLTAVDTTDIDHLQHAGIPMKAETHGGEDVAIYADGPRSHLVGGVLEQNVIFHILEHALNLRSRAGLGETP
ncbi:MAG: alkaline phosphatase, partial [Myxococcota bacterium]